MNEENQLNANQIIEKINARRDIWTSNITENVIEQLSSDVLSKLNTAEVYALSYREKAVSELYSIKGLLFKAGANYDEKYEKEYKKYMFSTDVKLSPAERTKCIDNKLRNEKELIDLYERYITFLSDCVKTLDNFAYAIKNKYDTIKWKEGAF